LARCSVAVAHRPLPGIVSTPFTHRSTLVGTKDTGSEPLLAPPGQPVHAAPPAAPGPPLSVDTGAGDADGAVGAVACPGAPLLAVPPLASTLLGAVPAAPAPDALAHPAASTPTARRGTARTAVGRAAMPARVSRPPLAIDEISVLMVSASFLRDTS
jgi:hypothetical protein